MANPRESESSGASVVKDADVDEPKFHRERLVGESVARLGVEPHVVAGALSAERKNEFTIVEAKRLVTQFLAHEV